MMQTLKLVIVILIIFSSSAKHTSAEEVVSAYSIGATSSLAQLAPETKNAEDIEISWAVVGIGYGLLFGHHLVELRYLPGQLAGNVDPFYYRIGDKIIYVKGLERVDIVGLYYAPFWGPGFNVGVGYEHWEFRFKSSGSIGTYDQADDRVYITTAATILDIGYQIGGEDSLAFIAFNVRFSNRSNQIISGSIGYKFD